MIIFIANQFIGNKLSTGGDVLAIEIAKRIKNDLVILAPSQIHPEISKAIVRGRLIDTDNFRFGLGTASSLLGGVFTVLHYLVRSWISLIWLLKNIGDEDTLYLTGDFICNSLPSAITKMVKPKIKVLANFYHRNPLPGSRQGNNYLISYFSRRLQGISLGIIKRITFRVFVLSLVGKQELLKEGFVSSNIIISGAGINIVKNKQASSRKKNQIVFIGRMNATKGAFDLIEILHTVVKRNKMINLIMIGGTSESDLNKLNEFINRFHLKERVKYLGFVSEAVKNQILSESRALVLPSKEEGFGIVIMEAIAFNTPVVCYDLPALKAVFSKYKTVSFVKRFQKVQFANKIIEVISNPAQEIIDKVVTWDDVYRIQSGYF